MKQKPPATPGRTGVMIGIVTLVLGAAGITSCLGPDDDEAGLLQSFEVAEFADQTTGPPEAEDGKITIRRRFDAPCVTVPETLGAEAEQNGTDLTLMVRWVSPTNACAFKITEFFYEAVLGELSSDTYTLRILHIHQFPNSVTRQDTVMTDTIEV